MPPAVPLQPYRKRASVARDYGSIPYAYEWTYSTRWWGCPTLHGVALEGVEDPKGELPVEVLEAQGTVLWHHELEQYADDLEDKGGVAYSIRARVMPGHFLVLARMSLQIRGVISRQVDTRWCHVFGSSELLREWSWRERTPAELDRRRQYPAQKSGPELLRPADTQRRADSVAVSAHCPLPTAH